MAEPGGHSGEHGPRTRESRETELPKKWAAVCASKDQMKSLRDNWQGAGKAKNIIETQCAADYGLVSSQSEHAMKGGDDATLSLPEHGLYVVFDGVQTHEDTDVGIAIAKQILAREIASIPLDETDPTVIRVALERAVEVVEDEIDKEQRRRRDAGEPTFGYSTVALTLIRGDHVFSVGKGDSPIRIFRPHAPEGQRLERLNTNHDLAHNLLGDHPDIVKNIQDVLDNATTIDDIPNNLALPRPSMPQLTKRLEFAVKTKQNNIIEAIKGLIAVVIGATKPELTGEESKRFIWHLFKGRAGIYGTLGKGTPTEVGVTYFGPDDVLILDSDGISDPLTAHDTEEILETEDDPQAVAIASAVKVLEKILAKDPRGKGDDATRQVVKRRTALEAIINYTEQIKALLADLQPAAEELDVLPYIRRIEANEGGRRYEAVRAARQLLTELENLREQKTAAPPPPPDEPPPEPEAPGAPTPEEVYREIADAMRREGWLTTSRAGAENPSSLPFDHYCIVARVENPLPGEDQQDLYFFQPCQSLEDLPSALPSLLTGGRMAGEISGFFGQDRVSIDASGREQHEREIVPLSYDAQTWRVSHSSERMREALPGFAREGWFHVDASAIRQWTERQEMAAYEGEFLTFQAIRLEDDSLHYFGKLSTGEPAHPIVVDGQTPTSADVKHFVIQPRVIRDQNGRERAIQQLHNPRQTPDGRWGITGENIDTYQQISRLFYQRGWRAVSRDIVRAWDTGSTSNSALESSYLTIARVQSPGQSEPLIFCSNGPAMNIRAPGPLPNDVTVDMQWYRRLRRVSDFGGVVGHLEPVRPVSQPRNVDDERPFIEHTSNNPRAQAALELEVLLNDHEARWMRTSEFVVRDWETTLITSFDYQRFQQSGMPLEYLTITAIENPDTPGQEMFFCSFHADRNNLGLPSNRNARGTVYRIRNEGNLIALTPESSFTSRAGVESVEETAPDRITRATPPIREGLAPPVGPPMHAIVQVPREAPVEAATAPSSESAIPPTAPTKPEPKSSWFQRKFGRRVTRALGIVAVALGLRGDSPDSKPASPAPPLPDAGIERILVEDAGITRPAPEVSQAPTPKEPQKTEVPRQPAETSVHEKTTGETPEPIPEVQELKHNIATVSLETPGIQKTVIHALEEQGIPRGVALKAVEAAARFRHSVKDPLSHRVFVGDRIHFVSYVEDGTFTVRIGDVESAREKTASPAQPKPPAPPETVKPIKAEKEWQRGEIFSIDSQAGARTFTVGDPVYFTPKSGVTAEYEIVGPSFDGGLMMQKVGTKRQFAVNRTTAEKVIKKKDVDSHYTEPWMLVTDEEEKVQVDAEGNQLLGKRRVIFPAFDGQQTGKGIVHALKRVIAEERGISLDEAYPEASVALRSADIADPNTILLGQGFVYDLDTMDLEIIR